MPGLHVAAVTLPQRYTRSREEVMERARQKSQEKYEKKEKVSDEKKVVANTNA